MGLPGTSTSPVQTYLSDPSLSRAPKPFTFCKLGRLCLSSLPGLNFACHKEHRSHSNAVPGLGHTANTGSCCKTLTCYLHDWWH